MQKNLTILILLTLMGMPLVRTEHSTNHNHLVLHHKWDC
jgi:hypothetical protein